MSTMEPETSMSTANDTFWHGAYEAHSGALFGFLSSRLGRRDEAEDLLHETFVRAIRSADRVRDLSKIRSYLFTIANNLLINRHRRRGHTLFSELGGDDATVVEFADSEAESPHDASVLDELSTRLAEAVEALTPTLRQAFVLAVVEGRAYDEIADLQGWSPVQVRVNVCRARKKLMRELGPLLEVPGENDDARL